MGAAADEAADNGLIEIHDRSSFYADDLRLKVDAWASQNSLINLRVQKPSADWWRLRLKAERQEVDRALTTFGALIRLATGVFSRLDHSGRWRPDCLFHQDDGMAVLWHRSPWSG